MERIRKPRERSLEPPEPSVWCECDVCGLDIYEGEEFWCIDETNVCNDCLRTFAEEYFENCREVAQKAKNFEEE